MKVAVIGSRSITSYPLEEVVPPEVTEIISGGARGVDTLAFGSLYMAGHARESFLRRLKDA